MRIAVIGAGGVGGPFGAALARAGHDVTFLARGAHLEAMRTEGLRVEGVLGDFHLQPTQATDDAAEIGKVADGVVVGSAIVQKVADGAPPGEVLDFVRDLAAGAHSV